MSDFFMSNQNENEFQSAAQFRNNIQKNQQEDIEAFKQKKQERVENWNRYGVDVPDQYYKVFNQIISNAPTPEEAQEEAYKIGSAVKYSRMMNIPIDEAYKNVDSFNEAMFTDMQGQKGRFEALSDMLTLGGNNVKLGRLGQQLMQAHGNNDTELADALMKEIEAISQQNTLMQDNAPRTWVMEALEAGAQSLPFTGVVAGAGIVGNFIAPIAGTGASFAASSYLSAGTEYIDLIANGASPETARLIADISGGIQGIIEADLGITKGIVKGSARLLGKKAIKEITEEGAKKGLEEIGRKVFKRFHFGAGKKLLINYLENRGKDILGEGTEEFLQELTSIAGQEIAASLDGYDIPDDDAKHIVKQCAEAFRGGVLGALSMGFIPAGINAAADVKKYKFIKDTAELYESEEMFKEAAKDSPVFEGMNDKQKADTLHEVWQRAQNRIDVEAQKLAEGRDFGEGAEEVTLNDEGEPVAAEGIARNEAGRLYTSDEVNTDDDGNVTGGTFLIGDVTKKDKNRYGYITYSTDEEGNITIDDFKMNGGHQGLRAEVFDEFAREHPDVKIEWNPIGNEWQEAKEKLIEANPSGAKNGLNYYSSNDLDNIQARKMVADEVRKNIHNVKKNADGTYTRTELNNKQVAAAVTLIESAARRMNMGLSEYVSKTFGNQIFGSKEEFARATLAQGEDVNTKAGGMSQGVAQANWREVGQMVKAVIYAGENADFSTWAHEMAHVFQSQLDGDLRSEAESAFNVQGGDWTNSTYTFSDGRTMSSAEAFAYGFQDWLETGKAESEQMKNIFQKFAEFIADAYNRLKNHLTFSPEIESVFNKLLDGDDTIMSKALKAAQEQEGEYRAKLKRDAEEKEASKKREAEQAKKQAEAEREEESEGTEFEEKEEKQSAQEIEKSITEVKNEEANAIDNALENTNLTDEKKAEIAEILKDENSTVVEKAEAATEAASSAYDEDNENQYPELLYQLAGEPSIRRMAEGEEKQRILDNLEVAVAMEEKFKSMDSKSKASRIRMMTGWERDANGQWKYELDDSINRIIGGAKLAQVLRSSPDTIAQASENALLNLGDILDAPELFKVFPYMKNVRVSFYSDPNAFRAVLTSEGIKVNVRYLQGVDGEKGLKGVLAHEVQHVIQALEYADSKGLQGRDIEQLYTDMMNAMQAAGGRKYDYDITSLKEGLDAYMQDAGEIEARNVARRIMMNADQRRMNTLASTEDVQRKLLFQTTDLTQEFADIASGKITDQDIKNYINSLIGQAFDTATTPLQIQIVNGNKAHVFKSNVKLVGTHKTEHNAALNKIEQIINNASMIGKSKEVDLSHNTNKATLKHKQKVAKYISFESPIKIGNDYYTVELITERMKNQRPDLLNLYNVRVQKNNGAATPSNPNGLGVSQTAVTSNNNITTGGNVNTGILLYQNEAEDLQEATKKAQELLFMNELSMYGIHNLSEDALRHAVKMGGLANPSMAVVDTEKNSFTNFGEVSLIPYNYMLEKGEGSKGTFGADIYSPRYPSIDKRVTETGQKKVHAIFHAIEDENYKNQLEEKLVQKIENSSKQFDYAYSPLVMAYLAEKGNKDFYKYEKSEYSDEVKDLIKSLGASPNAMAEKDNKVILEAYSKHLKKDYEEQLKKLREDFEELKANPKTPEWIKNSRSRAIEKLQEDLDIANETIKELVDEKTGLFNGNVADDFLYRVRHEIESAGKIDYSASEYAARELIENDPEFLPWAKEAYDRIEKEERIFNGFTPSGNRRYLAHTLENVSEYMRQQELQGGESFYYGLGSTRAKFTPNFKTLNQIKKARDRLISHEEFEKIKDEYNERFDKITEVLGDKYDPDVGAARFEEAFEYGKSDPIGYIEKEYGISVDDDMAQEILDFATALRVMPTEYFETKFTRPVELNEFAGAIIPSNLSQDLKDTLAEKGLMIEEYDREAGNREEVTKAALQKFNETRRVLFQVIGEEGTSNLDREEEVTTRMDNLITAKEMEKQHKSEKTIRLATGWEKGTDGKWRYEIPDFKLKENPTWELKRNEQGDYHAGTLRELIDAPELFKAYPELKNYSVHTSLYSKDYLGQFSDFLEDISLNNSFENSQDADLMNQIKEIENTEEYKKYKAEQEAIFKRELNEDSDYEQWEKDLDKLEADFYATKIGAKYKDLLNTPRIKKNLDPAILSTLIHEVQHAIQAIEGFARGGNEETARNEANKTVEYTREEKQQSNWYPYYLREESAADFALQKKRIMKNPELIKKTGYWQAHSWAVPKKGTKEYTDYVYERINGWMNETEAAIVGDDGYGRVFEDWYKKPDDELKKIRARNKYQANKYRDLYFKIYNLDAKKKEFAALSDYELYQRLAGEVEARNVQERMNYTPEQRLNTLLKDTEDVAPNDKIILFQTAYHGSGADFDKFNTDQYGLSGEGSMSFGYGTYLTDNKDIARDYAERQRNTNLSKESVNPYERNTLEYEMFEDLRQDSFNFSKALYKKYLEEQAENIKKDPDNPYQDFKANEKLALLDNFDLGEDFSKTYLYTVEIPDDGYLDWEKELSVENAIKFVNQFINYAEKNKLDFNAQKLELPQEWSYDGTITGRDLYARLDMSLYGTKTNKIVSQFLYSIGYAGIKYPAGTIHGNGNSAYNYVIFNDDDAKIVNKLLFQTQAELMDEAKSFDSWQEFMDYCEFAHADDEVSPIPGDADAQWYQTFWEEAQGIVSEQEKNEKVVSDKIKRDGMLPGAVDALFSTYIKETPEMLDEFLHEVARIDAEDLNSEMWAHVEDEEGSKEREQLERIKDYIEITLSDYNWQSAMRRVQGDGEISEGTRKRLIGEMTDSFKVRDFRALYAEVMGDEQYAVEDEDSTTAMLNKKLKKYHDIVKPSDDIAKWSPEKRKRLSEQITNKEIASKIKNGSLKLDDELDAYIKSLNSQIKEKQKQFDELEKETKADYQRIADAETRKLLKLHEELLLARGKLNSNNAEVNRKINKGLKITEKYQKKSQNLNANYDEIFRKFTDLKNGIQITAEVQAALDRQEQVAGLKEDLNAKQKEKNLTAEVKKMRIQLVKRTMRRVPFERIDINNAKTVIAIQRMLEPNLIGGVNKFIGIDSPYLRGVISQFVTDSDYKEKVLNYLSKNTKASKAFADFKKKLEELKTIKDFDSWTAKERKNAIKYLPKENWVKDLNLLQLAKEREESIDLDINTEEYNRPVYDEKTGEIKTYKDANGNEYNVTETAFRLTYSDELGQLVRDAVGADMFDKIINMPFSEWTTEDLETLAQRIDELYKEGRELKAAKDEARKREADAIRKKIEEAIKETGITFSDDDTPEERERKQKKINKILGMNSDIKGTEAAKSKGISGKLNRLLHSYSDMNVLRFARMLDNQSEGENVRMLYRREDDCYIAKTRSMNERGKAINKVMADNKITEGDLAQTVEIVNTVFTVDELLYFLAADKDYAEDESKLKAGLTGLNANDDYAATSRNAVMFGNMLSDMESQEEKENWVQMDKDMDEAIKNDTLSTEDKQLLAIGQLDKKPGTTAYINRCKAKWEAVIAEANTFLENNSKYKALMEAIEADYASQYERMNEVSINEFNMPVHRVRAYVPLVRRESNGEDNVNQVREDLLAAYGAEAGKQWVNKGMTQRRVNISPLKQKPVQTGLFRTWGDSVERTEHFIAYSPYVRQLNAVYKSRDAAYTRRYIESRYGAKALKYLDDYINEVANPNAGRIREKGAEWLHVLRGKTAPAYLGWKVSGIIKQGLTSPWPYMQFVNPAEYTAAALKFTFNPEIRDAIKEKSVYMNNRVMDPINDLVDEIAENAKGKLDRSWSKFTKMGMQGLEMIDWACVAPGWLACYEKKYNQLQKASDARYNAKMAELKERNLYAEVGTSEYLTAEQMEAQARKELIEDIETEAVRYADDCTRQCQPSSRATDLAPLFKNSSEAMKAFLQFQTSLNVIWQNLRYDLPYAVKQRDFKRIAGTVIGYVCAGIFMNSVMEGIGGDDDDDETQALRNLIYYSTTQFTDSIPIMGSEITNVMDQFITGKRGFASSGTDMTPSATKLLSVLTTAKKGNWEKAAALTAEGIGLYLGAPVSGTKEIYKLLGKPFSGGDVNLKRGVSDVYGIAGDILEE